MSVWEIDFYRRPVQDETGHPLWEWVICDDQGPIQAPLWCPQSDATADWVLSTLQTCLRDRIRPETIRVFRPQTFHLLEHACQKLGLTLEPTRQVPTLKHHLQQLANHYPENSGYTHQPYDPLAVDRPPPIPLDDHLLGQQWQFATLPARDVVEALAGHMIPIREIPTVFLPLTLGLGSTVPIPGVVIEGGRRSLRIAQWVQSAQPVALNYVAGSPDGLILEAGLVDRWIIATFTDPEVAQAAREFEQRKQTSRGLHFLLIQPDQSGVTYSGYWLLKQL